MRKPIFFQNCVAFNANQNKKYHNFERIKIRTTVFLKWADLTAADTTLYFTKSCREDLFSWMFMLRNDDDRSEIGPKVALNEPATFKHARIWRELFLLGCTVIIINGISDFNLSYQLSQARISLYQFCLWKWDMRNKNKTRLCFNATEQEIEKQ